MCICFFWLCGESLLLLHAYLEMHQTLFTLFFHWFNDHFISVKCSYGMQALAKDSRSLPSIGKELGL
jgi:hypothetical protein